MKKWIAVYLVCISVMLISFWAISTFAVTFSGVTPLGGYIFEWDYTHRDDRRIDGFALFVADTAEAFDSETFVFDIEEAVCTSAPYVHRCVAAINCGQYAAVYAYSGDEVSESSNIFEYTCD